MLGFGLGIINCERSYSSMDHSPSEISTVVVWHMKIIQDLAQSGASSLVYSTNTAMRKLLPLVYGVLKNDTPFNPNVLKERFLNP